MERYELDLDRIGGSTDQEMESLQDSLARLDAMKQEIIEAILQAKQKKMTEHVERLRALLCRLVVAENALLEEMHQRESAALAVELDRLEAECGRALPVQEPAAARAPRQSRHSVIAVRYSVAAGLIGLGGVIACLLGCVIYLILVQIPSLGVTFELPWILANTVGAVLFAAAGLSLNQKSRLHDEMAAEELSRISREDLLEAQRLAAERADIKAQAYAAEIERERQTQEPEENGELAESDGFFSVKKVKVGKTESLHVDVKGNPAVLLTAAFAGAAAVMGAFWVGKRSGGDKKPKSKPQKSDEKKQKKMAKRSKKK